MRDWDANLLVSDPVFLALVTTEPGGAGAIVRLEAERLEAAGQEQPHVRRMERLAQPPARLTLAQARATGLTNKQLDAAPELPEVLEDLIEFSQNAGCWIVAEGDSSRETLARAAAESGLARGLGLPVIGVDDLGAVVHPTVCRTGIGDLARHYGLYSESALRGAALLRELWARLEADLLRLPLPLIGELNWLLAKTSHPLEPVLKEAERRSLDSQFAPRFTSGKLALKDLFKDFSDLLRALAPRGEEEVEGAEASPPEKPVTGEEVAQLLGPAGPLAKALTGYEERGEQIELARSVAAALSEGRHLVAEAGTGVGKSLAYLAPSLLFAQRAGRPVMISTHTKNLQSQLFHKDLPLLKQATGWDFKTALLKGRPNYLCIRKLLYTLQDAAHELEDDERAALLPVVTWSVQTRTGDVAELAAFSPEMRWELWDRLHTVGEDCLSRQCPFFSRCFVYRARALARTADVVVLNHALVFAEMGLEAGTLPPYHEVIFDEGHTLEDVATEHLACEVTPRRVRQILHRLFRTQPGSTAGKGLLPSLLFQLEQSRSALGKALGQSVRQHALEAVQAVGPAEQGLDVFFDRWREWFGGAPGEGRFMRSGPRRHQRGRGRQDALEDQPQQTAIATAPVRQPRPNADSRRFSAQKLRPEEAENLRGGKETLVSALGRLRRQLERLEEDFKELKKADLPRLRETQKDLYAQNLFLQELIADLEFVVKGDEPNYVYWAERLGQRSLRVVAAPLDISALLHEQLYERKRSAALVSATLSVRDASADAGSGFMPVRPVEFGEDESQAGPWDAPPAAAVKAGPHAKSFEFIKQRLGLNLCARGKVDELLEGSPFDYARNCRLYVPAFLPEPGSAERDFNSALSALLGPLLCASGGRALVLYTSYEALQSGAAALRKALAAERIEVLAQGMDGSREALLDRLRAGGRTALLGTTSFWEGVDVPGQALSLLVIAKLPFAVFTDPLVEGRCELLEAQGKDPFLHFSVPNAILRLRQGFGRLIRTKTDRGVVVLCDRRVLTRRYGPAFLRALPVPARRAPDPEQLVDEVRRFLDQSGPAEAAGARDAPSSRQPARPTQRRVEQP